MQSKRFFKKSMCLLAMMPLVTMTAPVFAQAETVEPLNTQDLSGQCRAANRPTPVFSGASTLTSALRILANNEQVTLAGAAQGGMIAIRSPIQGYVQTGVLKTCETPARTSCRIIRNPAVINVRNQPKIPAGDSNSNVIAQAQRGDRVFAVLKPNGSISTAVADGYNWVEISFSPTIPPGGATGWLYNSRVGSSDSNLAYCN